MNTEIVDKLSQIGELKGKTEHISLKAKDVLTQLVKVAKIESTDASNRIEGIFTSATRLEKLINQSTMPKNRSEEEISGYRNVLTLIHENYPYIPITANSILALHKELFAFTSSTWGGSFKDSDNQIVTRFADGHSEVRFNPPPAFINRELVENLCDAYNQAIQEHTFPELIIDAAFMLDFVSIHPFRDGNGRMSRLLMLLTTYRAGYDVGKYISLERLIEQTKSAYYDTLLRSSGPAWEHNKNDYQPYVNYFLSIVLQAYRELNDRIDFTSDRTLDASEMIIKALQNSLKPLSRRELMNLIPQYGETSIKHALASLRQQQKIDLVGKGRASRYVLK